MWSAEIFLIIMRYIYYSHVILGIYIFNRLSCLTTWRKLTEISFAEHETEPLPVNKTRHCTQVCKQGQRNLALVTLFLSGRYKKHSKQSKLTIGHHGQYKWTKKKVILLHCVCSPPPPQKKSRGPVPPGKIQTTPLQTRWQMLKTILTIDREFVGARWPPPQAPVATPLLVWMMYEHISNRWMAAKPNWIEQLINSNNN